jgi:hypothetical protein
MRKTGFVTEVSKLRTLGDIIHMWFISHSTFDSYRTSSCVLAKEFHGVYLFFKRKKSYPCYIRHVSLLRAVIIFKIPGIGCLIKHPFKKFKRKEEILVIY